MNKNARKIRNALFNSMGQSKKDDILHSDAADLIARQSSKIKHEITKTKRLMQENEELRNQVYNLTLYLHDIIGSEMDYISERNPGLPGYNPAILEVYGNE